MDKQSEKKIVKIKGVDFEITSMRPLNDDRAWIVVHPSAVKNIEGTQDDQLNDPRDFRELRGQAVAVVVALIQMGF